MTLKSHERDINESVRFDSEISRLIFSDDPYQDCDPALISSLRWQFASCNPIMFLLGQQGTVIPNESMKSILDAVAGTQVTGRPVMEVLPQLASYIRQIASDSTTNVDHPVLLTQPTRLGNRSFHIDLKPVIGKHGGLLGVQGIAVDVTPYITRIQELLEAEMCLRLALDSSEMVGVWELDSQLNVCTADIKVAKAFGLAIGGRKDETVNSASASGIDVDGVEGDRSFLRAIHAEDRSRVKQALDHAIRTHTPYQCRYRVVARDEKVRWVITSGKPCYDESGELTRILGVVIDITDQVEIARILEDSRFQFETLTEALPQIVWSCDGEGKHDYFSGRWSEFTGILPAEITESTWKQLVFPEHWDRVSKVWDEARTLGTPYDIDYRFRHHTGEYRWLRVMALPIRDENGQLTRWFGTSTDIHESYLASTERERLTQELERIASEDHLTSVLTRRAFTEQATASIQASALCGESVGMIMLDVDFFKQINDTYGHPGGDQVLSIIARRIRASVHKHDLVGRLGGDEFCLLMRGCDANQAIQVAERIRSVANRNPISIDEHTQVDVTISIGVTAKIPGIGDLETLLSTADRALYRTKSMGRNQVVFLAQ